MRAIPKFTRTSIVAPEKASISSREIESNHFPPTLPNLEHKTQPSRTWRPKVRQVCVAKIYIYICSYSWLRWARCETIEHLRYAGNFGSHRIFTDQNLRFNVELHNRTRKNGMATISDPRIRSQISYFNQRNTVRHKISRNSKSIIRSTYDSKPEISVRICLVRKRIKKYLSRRSQIVFEQTIEPCPLTVVSSTKNHVSFWGESGGRRRRRRREPKGTKCIFARQAFQYGGLWVS